MPRQFNDVDDFLGHSGSSGGGAYLKGWKKAGKIDVWLHTLRLPVAIWQHTLPTLVPRDEDDGPVIRVWSKPYNCRETEDVLKNRRRNTDGTRVKPFERCPICRLNEWSRLRIDAGELDWTKPIFRFEGDNKEETALLHTGGICNAYNKISDYEDEEEKKAAYSALKKAGINPAEAWKENWLAKLNYILLVVDNAHVDQGVLKTTEPGLLGQKVQDVIAKARESLGEDDGNPFLHPFMFRWKYDQTQRQYDKKYDAMRMEKVKLSSTIKKLLTTEPPDLTQDIAPYNFKTVRAILEKHCLIKDVPWAKIFDVPEGDADEGEDEDDDEKSSSGKRSKSATASSSSSSASGSESASDSASESTDDEDEMVACDAKVKRKGKEVECGNPMKPSDTKCSKCGAVYEVEEDDEEEEEPPPPPIKSRSSVGKDKGSKKSEPEPEKSKKGKKGDNVFLPKTSKEEQEEADDRGAEVIKKLGDVPF